MVWGFYCPPEHVCRRPDPLTYTNHLTVGQLRKAMEGLPDDAPVVYQRIEDVYFEKHGWETVDRPDLDAPGQTSYIRAWCVCRRGEDVLFLDGHY